MEEDEDVIEENRKNRECREQKDVYHIYWI